MVDFGGSTLIVGGSTFSHCQFKLEIKTYLIKKMNSTEKKTANTLKLRQ